MPHSPDENADAFELGFRTSLSYLSRLVGLDFAKVPPTMKPTPISEIASCLCHVPRPTEQRWELRDPTRMNCHKPLLAEAFARGFDAAEDHAAKVLGVSTKIFEQLVMTLERQNFGVPITASGVAALRGLHDLLFAWPEVLAEGIDPLQDVITEVLAVTARGEGCAEAKFRQGRFFH